MAIAYNTSVVRDGLVLYLDAANPKSYPGTGAAWFDLSGNNFHMSLKNGTFFNSTLKSFDLDGVDDFGSCDGTVSNSVSATVANLGIGGNSPKTIIAIAQVREIGSNISGIFEVGDSGSIGRHYCLRLNSSFVSFRAQFWSTPDYDFSYDGRNNFSIYTVLYPADKIGRTYVNGVLRGQDASAFDLVLAGNRPFEMGRYVGANYGGFRIQGFLVYNRALSEQEIKKIQESFRGRYNI
jgi:hypothetical protein